MRKKQPKKAKDDGKYALFHDVYAGNPATKFIGYAAFERINGIVLRKGYNPIPFRLLN
jgi:hypothetical protein